MMTELVLKAGPALVTRTWQAASEHAPGHWVEADITERAHERLFDSVHLADDVTLGDLFGLMEASPVLKAVFARDHAEELCAEAAKGPVAPVEEHPDDALEWLELYQYWSLDTSNATYAPQHRLNFHGIGVVQSGDRPDMDVAKGARQTWGISMTNPRQMLHLPLRVNPQVTVCEDDVDAKGYGRTLTTVQQPSVTLGQVLHGVLWELSFYGAPAEAESMKDDLMLRVDELKADIAAGVELVEGESDEDFFAALCHEGDRAGTQQLFDSIGAHTPHAVMRALRNLEDDDNAAAGLAAALGESVVLKAEYRDLPARAVRKAFRLAGSSVAAGKNAP
jgi:hypothetical protein